MLPAFVPSQHRQDIRKSWLGLENNESRKLLAQDDPRYSSSLFARRGFHSSSVVLAKCKSDKPPTCQTLDKICENIEKNEPCQKPDLCRQGKLKCGKSEHQLRKENAISKTQKTIDKPVCSDSCISRGKCELPRTVLPPKMDYRKVTCPRSKYVKPDPCPPILEHCKDSGPHIEARQATPKKAICSPPPLPKPPYEPILLCPCPPPRKVRPGPCPCYEHKEILKRREMQPCPLKKKYPCPDTVHICVMEKKPCNLSRSKPCENRKRKEPAT